MQKLLAIPLLNLLILQLRFSVDFTPANENFMKSLAKNSRM
jgi:hypothetical protein